MSNHKGDLAEMDFKLKAMKKGLIVSSPENSQVVYDLLVDNGCQIFRIQVKSNFQDGLNYAMNLGCGSKNKKSYLDQVHFMACYINELNAWYIFPMECIGESLKITIYPNSEDSKWNKYREAWDLFQ